MMGRRLSLVLTLLVALFVGVVPLRVCWSEECGSPAVVAAGSHSHHGHADGSSCVHDDGHEACEHEDADDPCSHEPSQPDDDSCCVDTPFHVVASVHVVSADRCLDSAVTVPTFFASPSLDLPSSVSAWAHVPAPPDVRDPLPIGLVSTVLLR